MKTDTVVSIRVCESRTNHKYVCFRPAYETTCWHQLWLHASGCLSHLNVQTSCNLAHFQTTSSNLHDIMLNSFVSIFNISYLQIQDSIPKIHEASAAGKQGRFGQLETHCQVSMNMKTHMAHLKFRSQDNSVKKINASIVRVISVIVKALFECGSHILIGFLQYSTASMDSIQKAHPTLQVP